MDASDQATFDALKDTIVFELRAQLAMRESGLDLREIEAIAEMVADQVLTEHEVIRRAEAEPFPRRRDRAAPVSAPDIVAAIALEPYVVRVFFADGQLRDVDIEPLLESPIFGQLRDHEEFARVYVDEKTLTVAWPNGADLDPDVIYGVAPATGEPAARVTTPESV